MNIHKIISIRNISFLCNKFKNWLDSFIFGIDDLPYRWQLQLFFFFFLLWVLQSRLLRYYHCCLRQKHDSLNVVYFLRMFLALLTLDYGNYSLEALNISNVMRDSYFENRTRTYFTHTHICVCELGGCITQLSNIHTYTLYNTEVIYDTCAYSPGVWCSSQNESCRFECWRITIFLGGIPLLRPIKELRRKDTLATPCTSANIVYNIYILYNSYIYIYIVYI